MEDSFVLRLMSVGKLLGKSIGEVMELSVSEINAWLIFIEREKG